MNDNYGKEFGSDENFAFIAGFTSNGAPYGITHEEMKNFDNIQIEIKKEDTKNFNKAESEINDDELPF